MVKLKALFILCLFSQIILLVNSQACRIRGEICSVGKHCCRGLRCDPTSVQQDDAAWGFCTGGTGQSLIYTQDTDFANSKRTEEVDGRARTNQLEGLEPQPTVAASSTTTGDDVRPLEQIAPTMDAYLDNGDRSICSSDVCKQTAQQMLATMNDTADPCDNFYNYACGNWIASHPIPDNQTGVTQFTQLAEQARKAVQDMLGSRKRSTFASEAKAKAVFRQCLNQDEIERLRAKPLLDMLNEQIGGWPILNPNWDPNKFDFLQALSRLRLHGDEPFFLINVRQDRNNSRNNFIDVVLPTMIASVKLLNNTESGMLYTQGYIAYLTTVTSLLLQETGDSRPVADSRIVDDLTKIMELKRYMAMTQGGKAFNLADSRTNSSFPQSALFQNLTTFIKTIFTPVDLSYLINPRIKITLADSVYFDRIDERISQLERMGDEGKRQLANYLGWKIITRNLQLLSKDYRDTFNDYYKVIYGQKARQEQTAEERCATDVVNGMPLTIGAMYVRDYVPIDLRPKISIMINDLKLGFAELLTTALTSWMDRNTYLLAIKKLNYMAMFPGHPGILSQSIPLIDDEYKEMERGFNYFTTTQEMRKLKNFKSLEMLRGKKLRYNPITDYNDITIANAYNSLGKNLILVLASILKPPFYQPDNPQYINYGGIGWVIGHEITHGFDSSGRYYDEVGQYRNWWTLSTSVAYNKRKETLVEQYNSFSTSVGTVNGTLTLPENIADNGGLKAAYQAYFSHYAAQLLYPEPMLPGFNNDMTIEQLFFLSAGQVYCAAKRPELERIQQLSDPHSPSKFRVLATMSNMPEFAKAFNCPLRSGMNPVVKPAVW